MKIPNLKLPSLVRRMNAPQLVLNVLIAFGATVLIVRVFLDLTGYPRLGNSTLHIAHLLYGGIVLTAACLMMLIYATPTTQRIGSILTGIGLGLFFDEVGKFITSNNDYFFKPAAPIIYLVSLVIAAVFFLLRRGAGRPTDAELMVNALEDAELLLEGRQTERYHRHIDSDLNFIIANLKDPDHVALAHALQTFANSEAVRPGQSRWLLAMGKTEHFFLRQFIRRQKLASVVLLVVLALNSLASLVTFFVSLVLPVIAPAMAAAIQQFYISAGLRAFSPFALTINDFDLILNVITALITLYGIILFVSGRRQHGLFWVQLALILDLCVVNVFTFYVEQFSAVLLTFTTLAVLIYTRYYQQQLRQAQLHLQRSALSQHPDGKPAPSTPMTPALDKETP
ncbi:MAG TPA: hypothetical protein VGK87_16505 [Anaerolineae bacterium]